ncbi:DUF3048 domain-containing protein [Eubacteriales bacterium mix99]|mgnify:FL=1|jgi:hypothetical protein
MKKRIFIVLCISILAALLLVSCSGDPGLHPDRTPKPAPIAGSDDQGSNGGEDDVDIEVQPGSGDPSPITGLDMNADYKPVAVMVENIAAARPQSGVIDADLVYEANAEGGITRLLAVFQSKMPEVAGPVRSVRHYYMYLAEQWDAYLVHYGQSFIAKDMFDRIDVQRLNGLYDERLFTRDSSRKAPHNVYINVGDCRKKIDFPQKCKGFQFSSEDVSQGEPYQEITIPYHGSDNVVSYQYDESEKRNLRFVNGEKNTDRETGKQLSAKNIIVQYAKHSILEPGAGYRDIRLTGTGKAKYFIGGHCFDGTWERKGEDSSTVYYDESGKEVRLQPGNTWIQLVQTDMQVTVK